MLTERFRIRHEHIQHKANFYVLRQSALLLCASEKRGRAHIQASTTARICATERKILYIVISPIICPKAIKMS